MKIKVNLPSGYRVVTITKKSDMEIIASKFNNWEYVV
jgi:ribosomal protein L32E